jgi:alpha-1,2-mannosyltransferase
VAEAVAQTIGQGVSGDTSSSAEPDVTRRARASRSARWLRIVVVADLATLVAFFLITYAERHGFFDLNVYHGAIDYWVHTGGSLYDFVSPLSTYGFTYPPFAALMMLPMAITPWTLSIVVSCVACIAVSAVLVYWLIDPVARREGWTRWFAFAIAMCFAAAFEPLRETFLFGQVNMFLVFLVAADLLLFTSRGSKWSGIGIGLATAVKLTPGLFIVYLLVTKRWRAAFVSSLTAAVASILAAALAPDASRVFWTDALWNTDRIGAVAFVSNQSLNGAVARIHEVDPSKVLWLAASALLLVWWVVRVRRSAAAGDEMTGFALTGIVTCLVSPITWIHHLVWVGPSLLLLLDNALVAATRRRRIAMLVFLGFSYFVLCSRFVWNFHDNFYNPATWFFSSSYMWVSLALFFVLPIRQLRAASTGADATALAAAPRLVATDTVTDTATDRATDTAALGRTGSAPGATAITERGELVSVGPAAPGESVAEAQGEPDLGHHNGRAAGGLDREVGPAAVDAEAVPVVEGPRSSVALEHP